MPVISGTTSITADGSGDGTGNIVFATDSGPVNGIVTLIHVAPVGSVQANSTAAVVESGGPGRTIVSATSVSSAADLVSIENSNHFSTSQSRTIQVVIAAADENDVFNVYWDVAL